MSYGVHIIRVDRAAQSESHTISLEEWPAYINSDGEMSLKGDICITAGNASPVRFPHARL